MLKGFEILMSILMPKKDMLFNLFKNSGLNFLIFINNIIYLTIYGQCDWIQSKIAKSRIKQ